MKTQVKNLPKSQKEINVEISIDEMENYINKAAGRILQAREFDGFRKGKDLHNSFCIVHLTK